MKAWALYKQDLIENHPLKLMDLPDPEVEADKLLVKVLACGVCRTDLHVVEGDLPLEGRALPVIPGHQVVGEVLKAPPGSMHKEGDIVGIAWLGHTCGKCMYCKRGSENLCPNSRYTGYDLEGGFAEYTTAACEYAYNMNGFDEKPHLLAPLLCAGIIGYRAFKRTSLRSGDTLLLYGFGSSAHITIQIAAYLDINVYVKSRSKKHLELAQSMGALWAGYPHDLPPECADASIIFAPAGETVPDALKNVRPGGSVVSAGIYMSDIPPMSYSDTVFHEKVLTSVECNTREDGREFLELAKKAHIKPQVTTYSFDCLDKALLDLKGDLIAGSAVMTMS